MITENKDMYLQDVWGKVLQYLQMNCNMEPEIIDNFYRPCSLYDLTSSKAVILAPTIVNKQILQPESEMISAAFTDILQADLPITV